MKVSIRVFSTLMSWSNENKYCPRVEETSYTRVFLNGHVLVKQGLKVVEIKVEMYLLEDKSKPRKSMCLLKPRLEVHQRQSSPLQLSLIWVDQCFVLACLQPI